MPSADFLGTAEPALSNLFFVYFTRLPTITPLYVSSINLPDTTWAEVKSGYFISERKFATRATIGDWTLQVKDFVPVDTAAACYAWFKSIGDPNSGTLNPPGQYKSSGITVLTDGRGNPLNTWTLKGCWPSDIKFGEVKTEGGEIVIINLTIKVDVIELS